MPKGVVFPNCGSPRIGFFLFLHTPFVIATRFQETIFLGAGGSGKGLGVFSNVSYSVLLLPLTSLWTTIPRLAIFAILFVRVLYLPHLLLWRRHAGRIYTMRRESREDKNGANFAVSQRMITTGEAATL